MAIMATPEKKQRRRRREKPDTHYGKFLKWVMWKYDLNQEQLAEIMGTSQTTVSNWMKGTYEASSRSNALMAQRLKFNKELKAHHTEVFTYGQQVPASEPLLAPDDHSRVEAVQREWEQHQGEPDKGAGGDDSEDMET